MNALNDLMRDSICATLNDTRRGRLAIIVSNWILNTFAPTHARFVGGAIEYGMRSATRDAAEGRVAPPDWRRKK